jgi:hypothetical protein
MSRIAPIHDVHEEGASASTNTSPAANTRLTEQAAAEVLVSVSRVQERASGEERAVDDDEDEEEDEPRRKRVKRGANENTAASLTRRRSTRTKVSTREPTPEDDDADAGSKRRRKGSQRDILLVESRAGSLLRSSSRAAFHMDRYGRGYTANSPFGPSRGLFRSASAERCPCCPRDEP